ncbi:hypothetical protein KP2271_51580 [Klebsiella pneumoniae]|nr:hypothetical protein KP2271_51580 [Klebsiella pneumoniae]
MQSVVYFFSFFFLKRRPEYEFPACLVGSERCIRDSYREESIVERLKALTDGKKVAVVYDSVGKDTGRPLWTACSAAA